MENVINIFLQSGVLGAVLVALGYFAWKQNIQIKEMHCEAMTVQKELVKVLSDNTAAYIRLCSMLNDRPCLHQASALNDRET